MSGSNIINNPGAGGSGGGITQLTSDDGSVILNPSSGLGPSVDLSASGPGGGVTIGDPVSGGSHNEVLFVDASGNLGQSVNFQYSNASKLVTLIGTQVVNTNNITNTPTPGFTLQNLTPATNAGRTQTAPYLYFLGQKWNGSSSVTIGCRIGFQESGPGAGVLPNLKIDQTSDGTTFTNMFQINGTQATLVATLALGTGSGLAITAAGDGQITGDIYAGSGGAHTGTVRFQTSGADELILTTPSTLTNWTMTLPSNAGSLNQALVTDGSGNTSWASVAVLTPGQLPGTATNDNASAGNVGEYITAQLASGSATSLTTATPKNIISISLTAGDWDVEGIIDYALSGIGISSFQSGSSTTTATFGPQDTSISAPFNGASFTGIYAQNIPTTRYSLATTTTVFLVASATFLTGAITGYGTIRARRVR